MTRLLANLLLLLPLAASAQQPLILLDPARGGANSGAHIADRVSEKQVTLDLAGRLASLLRARGFDVSMTRETDVDVSNDARAAMANNAHPLACILLYAAPGGSGVHLYTSAQKAAPATGNAIRWDEAQAPYAERSRMLAADLRQALDGAHIPAAAGQTWMRPLDNMQCPAVAVELLPESNGTHADNSSYQGHVANAVANTLLQWRSRVAAMAPPPPAPAPASPRPAATPAPADSDGIKASPAAAPSPSTGTVPKPSSGAESSSADKPATTAARPAVPAEHRAPKPAQPAPVVREPLAPAADRAQP